MGCLLTYLTMILHNNSSTLELVDRFYVVSRSGMPTHSIYRIYTCMCQTLYRVLKETGNEKCL